MDISMTDSVFSFVSRSLRRWIRPDLWPHTEYPEVVLGPLEVKDKAFITVGNIEPYFWERFCRVIGREDFIPHKNAAGEKAEEVKSAIKAIMLTRTRDEWVKLLTEADTAISPVLNPEEVMADPHIRKRELVIDIPHPSLGNVTQMGFPIKLSDTPGQFRHFAPHAGQHSREILAGLGYTEADIDKMKKNGSIQ